MNLLMCILMYQRLDDHSPVRQRLDDRSAISGWMTVSGWMTAQPQLMRIAVG